MLKQFFKRNMTRNAGAPKGFWGFLMIQKMNFFHTGLSHWGLGFLPLNCGDKVLEIGCGGGRNLKRLARRNRKGIIYGMDISGLSVRRSRLHNLGRVMRGRVRVRQGNVARLPFVNDCFDEVVAFETIYYWPNLVQNFAEVRRVLRSGGRFLICNEDHLDPDNPHEHDQLKALLPITFYTNAEVREALLAAGFSAVERFDHENGQWVSFIATKGSEV